MSLCASKYDNTSSVLFRIYKYACRTYSLDFLMTCTLFEYLLINLRECQHFSGTPIDFAFDMYSEQNSITSSKMYLSTMDASRRHLFFTNPHNS